jgi:integrase
LKDAFDRLIRETESNAKALPRPRASMATVDFYRGKAEILLRILGNLPLLEVNAACVDAYIRGRRNAEIRESTIAKEIGTWRAALKVAKRAGLWGGDIAEVFPTGFSPRYEARERWLTYEEWRRLVADAEAQGMPESTRALRRGLLAAVAFMVATSAEWGAFERARREDVDLERFRVHVRGTKDAQKAGNRDRVIPIVHLGHAYLLAFAMRHADGIGRLFRARSNFRRDLAATCVRVGIERLSPNDLRRTHATWLRRAGVPAGQIGTILGHVNGRLVEKVYGRIKPIDLESAMTVQLAAASRW